MAAALDEARRGMGRTHPNPAVGAVVVAQREIVGRGFHRKVGLPHAEVEAIREAGPRARGADLYVTLSPCNHQGRTPPCTEAIQEAGIQRVFVGAADPNPASAGGPARLRDAGIEVVEGILRESCEEIIRPFAKHVTTGLPWVVLKAAATLDGKIATSRGDSKWVSGPESRALVHRWRDEMDAVLVGAGTVRIDDPLLTTRVEHPIIPGREPRTPIRVVVAGMGHIPEDARILDAALGPVLIAVPKSKEAAYWQLTGRHAELLPIEGAESHVDVNGLLRALGNRGITSLLVEGGASVHAAFLKSNTVDELRLFLAPRIAGGDGLSWTGPLGTESMSHSWRLDGLAVERVGQDVLVVGRPQAPEA